MSSSSIKNLVHWESLLLFKKKKTILKELPIYINKLQRWYRAILYTFHPVSPGDDKEVTRILTPVQSEQTISITISIFHVDSLFTATSFISPPYQQPLATVSLFSIVIILSFQECYLSGIIMYVPFEIGFFQKQHNSLEIHPDWYVLE